MKIKVRLINFCMFFFLLFFTQYFFLPIQFLLLETMANNDHGSLLEKPHLIFDCDESGFKFDLINKIVTAAQGTNHIPRVSKVQHKRVDVMVCASAAGDSLLPMFIFKSLSGQVLSGVQEGAPTWTLFACQKFDWIEKGLFLKWLEELWQQQVLGFCLLTLMSSCTALGPIPHWAA